MYRAPDVGLNNAGILPKRGIGDKDKPKAGRLAREEVLAEASAGDKMIVVGQVVKGEAIPTL